MAADTVRSSIRHRSPARGSGARRVWAGILPFAVVVLLGACDATVDQGPTTVPSVTPNAVSTAASSPDAVFPATPSPTVTASVATLSPRTPSPSPSATVSSPAPLLVGPGPCPGRAASSTTGPGDSQVSTNWSGYTATSGHPIFTCVEATWIQPTIHCSGSTRRALSIWVGIGGFDQTGLEQIGTEADCDHGSAFASAWHESLPAQKFEQQIALTVRAGDTIRARVRAIGKSVYELSIVNVTRNATVAIRDANTKIRATSAEWIVEAPTGGCPSRCTILQMPNFGKLRFSDTWLTVSGVRRSLLGSGFTHVNDRMVTVGGGQTRASVTSTAADGSSFVVTWRRS